MKSNFEEHDRRRLLSEIRTSRILNVLMNSRRGDEFLWHGSPNPTRVQRIGVWLIGLFCFALGLFLLAIARSEQSLFLGVFAVAWIVLGAKTFGNGFRKRRPKGEDIR